MLSIRDASEKFSVPYSTLAQALREGRVEGLRAGGGWKVDEQAVEEAIACGRLRPLSRTKEK